MPSWLRAHGRWLALGALILLNIVLLTLLLLRQTTTSAVPAPVAPSVASTSGPSASPSASSRPGPPQAPSATNAPSPSATTSPAPGARRLMAANSAKIAWRAEEGDCDHRSKVEVTTDGGRTWRKTDPGIRGIVRLRAYDEHSVFAVGADADCKPTYAWINAPDGIWHRDPTVIWDVWFTYPDDLDRVHAAGGHNSRPCGRELMSFAATGGSDAAVLCRDGRIRTTRTGADWTTAQWNSAAVALGADDTGILIARPSSTCDHVAVRRFESSKASSSGVPARCETGLGPIAVARHGNAIWRWVGDDVWVS